MADLTLRRVKLAPLTHFELDDNFLALEADIVGLAAGRYEIYIDNVSPATPVAGDLWLNKNVNELYIYDGTVWFQAP